MKLSIKKSNKNIFKQGKALDNVSLDIGTGMFGLLGQTEHG